nr:transposase [Bradyrhizobium sp. NAS96.2]
MIRVLKALVAEYRDRTKLYLSWDAASWHVSKRLFEHIDAHNATIGSNGPQINTAPLPARAQFLNVIEPVFSGLARAIIHNSNYGSIDEAIDRYFCERNAHFKGNPRCAGGKLWARNGSQPSSHLQTTAKTRGLDKRWRCSIGQGATAIYESCTSVKTEGSLCSEDMTALDLSVRPQSWPFRDACAHRVLEGSGDSSCASTRNTPCDFSRPNGRFGDWRSNLGFRPSTCSTGNHGLLLNRRRCLRAARNFSARSRRPFRCDRKA